MKDFRSEKNRKNLCANSAGTLRQCILLLLIGVLPGAAAGFLFTQLLSSGFSLKSSSLNCVLVQVEGNSMLPTFDGGTIYETCVKCSCRAPRPDFGTSVCPNCGWLVSERERETKRYQRKSAQEIQSSPLLEALPQEKYAVDDVVVCVPDEKTGPVIKRVAGRPGDRLEVRNGVLYRNGKRAVRSLEAWNQMRIPVFLDDFRPDGISRWIPIPMNEEKNEVSDSEKIASSNLTSSSDLVSAANSCASESRSRNSNPPQTASCGPEPLPNGWHFEGGKWTCLKYAHQIGRFTPTFNGRPECQFEPAPITNFRAENGTQIPNRSLALIDELLCTFELDWQISAPNSAPNSGFAGSNPNLSVSGTESLLIVSLPTQNGEHFFVLVPSESNLSKVKHEILALCESGKLESLAGGILEVGIYPIELPTHSQSLNAAENSGKTAAKPSAAKRKNSVPNALESQSKTAIQSKTVTVSTLDGIPRLKLEEKLIQPLERFFLTEKAEAETEAEAETSENLNGPASAGIVSESVSAVFPEPFLPHRFNLLNSEELKRFQQERETKYDQIPSPNQKQKQEQAPRHTQTLENGSESEWEKETESLVNEIFEIWNFDSEMDLDSDAGQTERKSDLTEKRSSEISDEMNETLNLLKSQNSRTFRQKLENFHYPSTARIWYCGPQDLKILHLSLYRGEYWQDFLTNFHYFSKNGEKMLAFECNLEYYLVGDNFFVSKDSRHWGTIPKDKIYGKVQQMER